MSVRIRDLLAGGVIGAVVAGALTAVILLSRHDDGAHPAATDEHADHAPAAVVDDHAGHVPDAADDDQHVQLSPQRLQSIGVRFEPAARRHLDRLVRTTGHVEIDERRIARVTLKVHGWIEELFVSATGDRVTRGQPLLTLYSPDLLATQEEHLQALASSRAIASSTVAEVARRADILADATRRRLQLWDVPDEQIQALEETGAVQRTLPIHSPISGTVINKAALQGAQVMPGDELYTIADLSHVWVLADVYEYELPFVRVGQEARISLSYEPAVTRRGRLGFIYPTLDPGTRTARVRFEVPNPGERLKPGMFVNVELDVPLGERLFVPRDAVLDTGTRQLIFLHHGDGLVAWRAVQIGVRSGEWVEILDGLEEGEHLITSPAFLIDSESQLKTAIAGLHGGH